MAATATEQIIQNGARNLVLKYTIAGTTGDAAAVKLVDVSVLDSAIATTSLTLVGVDWSLTGFSVKLAWDADTDDDLVQLAAGEGSQDYSKFGGFKNPISTGSTGDVMFTTTGYTAAGNGGHMVLRFRKT